MCFRFITAKFISNVVSVSETFKASIFDERADRTKAGFCKRANKNSCGFDDNARKIVPVWVKTNDTRYDNIISFGDKDDQEKRVYLITKDGKTEVKVPYGEPNEKGHRAPKILAIVDSSKLSMIRNCVEQQYENFMRGEKLIC